MKMIRDLIFSLSMVSCKLNVVPRKDSLHIQQSPLFSSIPCIPLKLRVASSWFHLPNPAFEIVRCCSFPGVWEIKSMNIKEHLNNKTLCSSDDFKNWIIKNEPLYSTSYILLKLFTHSLTGYWYFSYCLEQYKQKMYQKFAEKWSKRFKNFILRSRKFTMVKEVQETYFTASKHKFEVLTLFFDFIFLLLWSSWWKMHFLLLNVSIAISIWSSRAWFFFKKTLYSPFKEHVHLHEGYETLQKDSLLLTNLFNSPFRNFSNPCKSMKRVCSYCILFQMLTNTTLLI